MSIGVVLLTPRSIFILALLLAMTIAAYSASLFVPFVFDDEAFITGNPSVNFQQPLSLHSSRFLTLLSYKLNYVAGQSDPSGYHVVNLAIHLLNGVLVFVILKMFISDYGSLFGAGLFLLHPLQSEAVIYLSGRSELLAAFFSLLALGLYFKDRGWLAFTAFGFAVWSKESAIMLPLAIVTYEAIRRKLAPWPVWLATIAIFPALIQGARVFEHADRSWSAHFILQCGQLGRYLTMVIVPFGFSVDHDAETRSILLGLLAVVALAVIVAMAWQVREWYPLQSFGVLFLFIMLAPRFILNIPEFMAEHHLYLPMFGVVTLIASAFSRQRYDLHDHKSYQDARVVRASYPQALTGEGYSL